jgi:hypothetical protein
MYAGQLNPSGFGSSTPFDIPIQGNVNLQSQIAKDFTYQILNSVAASRVQGDPNYVLDVLTNALQSGDELYTIRFFMPDRSGGHAVTPFAVEDKGDGKKTVLIWDNNFPGDIRAMHFDTNSNTWEYVAGIDPRDTRSVYRGNADTKTLELDPLTPTEGRQPCPFCNGENASATKAQAGTVVAKSQQYNEIFLSGNPNNHAHLVLRDGRGNVTGFVRGKFVSHIPGVTLNETTANQDWSEAPEPVYNVPVGTKLFATIDATNLKQPDTEALSYIGPGSYVAINDIKLTPGQQDHLTLSGNASGFTYKTDARASESPTLGAGVEGPSASYGFAVKALGIKSGSTIDMYLPAHKKELHIDTTGTSGTGSHGATNFVISESRVDKKSGTKTYAKKLGLSNGDVALLNYGAFTGSAIPRADVFSQRGNRSYKLELQK